MFKIKTPLFILLFFLIVLAHSQTNRIINPPYYIKSIIIRPQITNNYTPVIKLGDSFTLEFDDLEADQKDYYYKIEHYDYNWNPSGLSNTEFINGFSEDLIRDYNDSFNTFQPYTNYKVRLPNDNTRFKISGNYLISIIDENDNVIFSRPFIIYQSKVNVGVSINRSRNIETLNSKHNVQFVINYPNLLINNPNQEIKVAVYQNNDWSTLIRDIKPQFIRRNQLLYKYVDKVSYWAGNEYLYFDTKQIRSATNNIAKIELNDLFDTYLYIDEERLHNPYTLNEDINGNYIIRTIDSNNSSTEADYTWVHFKLESNDNIGTDDIYIYGNFNGWQLTQENKMIYDESTKLYNGKLLLKQGFYNYLYVTASDKVIDNHAIEGSYYQTENDYYVLVYYRPFGSRYDQVIGYGNANSENLRN
jgi:hypothetical protein